MALYLEEAQKLSFEDMLKRLSVSDIKYVVDKRTGRIASITVEYMDSENYTDNIDGYVEEDEVLDVPEFMK